MSEKDLNNLIPFPGVGMTQPGDSLQLPNYSEVQANMTNVDLDPSDPNFKQWCDALEACSIAGKSGLDIERQMVVAAGDLHKTVRTGKVNARLVIDWQRHAIEFDRNETRAVALQIPPKSVPATHQLPESQASASKLVAVTRGVNPLQFHELAQNPQKIKVVGVSRGEQPKLSEAPTDNDASQYDLERARSEFFKKAA